MFKPLIDALSSLEELLTLTNKRIIKESELKVKLMTQNVINTDKLKMVLAKPEKKDT